MSIYSDIVTLFVVMDAVGTVPILLSILNQYPAKQRRKIILRESSIAGVILIVFAFIGEYILEGLGISTAALSIAGGIILFLIALQMVFPRKDQKEKLLPGDPLVVPIAVPLIAGPASLATVLLFATRQEQPILEVLIIIVIASILSALVLLGSEPLRRFLGERGLIAVERLMGMLLITIAVQMFLTGLGQYLK